MQATNRYHVQAFGNGWGLFDRQSGLVPIVVGELQEVMRMAQEKNGVPGNGLHSLSREEYDALPRHNWSKLKHIGRSPAHYRQAMFEEQADTAGLRLGRAIHCATLEPDRYLSTVAVWGDGRRYGKQWDAFKADHEGRDILTADEAAQVISISQAVRSNIHSARYVSGGRSELAALWTDSVYGLDCKARLDFEAKVGALVDLKTTRDASPEAFSREVWRYRYHVQAAFYSDGYEAACGKRLPYVLVAVEKEPPYVVQVYRVPDEILEIGRDEYRALLMRLEECKRDSHWPGYSSGELTLALPKWAIQYEDEEDLGGLDLVISEGASNGL